MSSERPTLAELADELEAEKPCGGYTAANAIALSPDTVALLAARLREADEALGHLEVAIQKEIAAEHRALDEWRETGGPEWRDDHPAMVRLNRFVEFVARARSARVGEHARKEPPRE